MLVLSLGGLSHPLGGLTQTLGGLNNSLRGLSQPLGGLSQPLGGLSQPLGGLGQPFLVAKRGGMDVREDGQTDRQTDGRAHRFPLYPLLKKKPVAQRQEMVIGTLALLWHFLMVAVM